MYSTMAVGQHQMLTDRPKSLILRRFTAILYHLINMNIYFAGSIRGGRQDQGLYAQIVALLGEYGTVLTDHVSDSKIGPRGEDWRTDKEIYQYDTDLLKKCDVVVAEVTTPSLGVGYEVAMAVTLNKKVLCLYRPSAEHSLSPLIAGDPKITVVEYQTIDQLSRVLKTFLKK